MEKNMIKVALDISKGIAVQAKGSPATIVGYGAAAGIVLIAGVVAASACEAGKKLLGK